MTSKQPYVDSERYRYQLVKDGERRYAEWHSALLKHRQEFLKQLQKQRQG